MKLLAELKELDLGINPTSQVEQYEQRTAVRAVVFDDEGNVVVSHVAKGDYWKIPGGGVEEGESIEEALERELIEEAGVEVDSEGEIGKIVEYRDAWKQKQTSHCYKARLKGKKGKPQYDPGEEAKGFTSHWMPYEEALEKFGQDIKNLPYEAKFMQTRDRMFLEAAARGVIPDLIGNPDIHKTL